MRCEGFLDILESEYVYIYVQSVAKAEKGNDCELSREAIL